MSRWGAAKARRVLAALLRIGWSVKRTAGSHRVLERAGWTDYVFAFHAMIEFECTNGQRFMASARRTFRRCKIRGCEKNALPPPLR